MWTPNGPSHPVGNYSFGKTWRYFLPGVVKSSLMVNNYVVSEYKILSYRATFTSITTSNANVTL